MARCPSFHLRASCVVTLFLCAFFHPSLFAQNGFSANSDQAIRLEKQTAGDAASSSGQSAAIDDNDNMLQPVADKKQYVEPAVADASVSLSVEQTMPIEPTQPTDTQATPVADEDFESKLVGNPSADKKQTLNSTENQNVVNPDFSYTAFMLAGVLLLIVILAWLFRRYILAQKRPGSSLSLDVVARATIGPRQSLCLVKLGRHLVLVGLSPNHMAALDTVEDPEEIALILSSVSRRGSASLTASFDQLVAENSSDYDDGYPDIGADSIENNDSTNADPDNINQARSELTGLLDKVKGLTRLHSR